MLGKELIHVSKKGPWLFAGCEYGDRYYLCDASYCEVESNWEVCCHTCRNYLTTTTTTTTPTTQNSVTTATTTTNPTTQNSVTTVTTTTSPTTQLPTETDRETTISATTTATTTTTVAIGAASGLRYSPGILQNITAFIIAFIIHGAFSHNFCVRSSSWSPVGYHCAGFFLRLDYVTDCSHGNVIWCQAYDQHKFG